MIIATETIILRNETLLLTNQRAIYWKAQEILILADLHIGKTAHFRKSGIPVSSKVLLKDLLRLQQLILYFKPKRLLVVGDLFHAEFNQDVLFFQEWMQQFLDLKILLVKGNHDKNAFELYDSLNIKIFKNEMELLPFNFVHEGKTYSDTRFYISGHTHPGVVIKGKGRQRIKLPCYQLFKNRLILPAFSKFTGLNTTTDLKATTCFAFTKTHIFRV